MKILLAAGCLLGTVHALGYRTTWTHSLPLGLYRSVEISPEAQLPRGTLVLICLPAEVGRWARGRGYLASGTCPGLAEPVGKPIAATPAHLVSVAPDGVYVDRRLLPASRLPPQDSRGRALPHPVYGTHEVPEEHLWLHAPHPRSLDSRVFGAVPRSSVRAVLRPVAVPGYPLDSAQLVLFLSTAAAACCLPFLGALVDGRSRGT